jgi:hypothetical protein
MPSAKGNIYAYMRSGFAGASPVVRVLSGGSARPRDAHHGKPSVFYFTVQVWVIYFERGTPAQQAEAEDTLDALERELTAWMGDLSVRSSPGLWRDLGWVGASQVAVRPVQGHLYLVEDVQIEVTADG